MHAETLQTSWHICMGSWTQGTYLRMMWPLQSLSCAQVTHLLSSKACLSWLDKMFSQLLCSFETAGFPLVALAA